MKPRSKSQDVGFLIAAFVCIGFALYLISFGKLVTAIGAVFLCALAIYFLS